MANNRDAGAAGASHDCGICTDLWMQLRIMVVAINAVVCARFIYKVIVG